MRTLLPTLLAGRSAQYAGSRFGKTVLCWTPSFATFVILLLSIVLPLDGFIPSQRLARRNTCRQLFFTSPLEQRKRTGNGKLPFVIEKISQFVPNDMTYSAISDMCIDVFFKEQLGAAPGETLPPWKDVQITYLKNLQSGDLRRRRQRFPSTNEMFLAYEVLPATGSDALKKPLILDPQRVYNLDSQLASRDIVRGELIGFVEITIRNYGLGDSEDQVQTRPILTNLAVSQRAREAGIGSTLLEECENHVAQNWNMGEIILEVEDYNKDALRFYGRRGYQTIYRDPASRRFDVSGLVLRKERCTREIMRKSLVQKQAESASAQQNTFDLFLQRFKSNSIRF